MLCSDIKGPFLQIDIRLHNNYALLTYSQVLLFLNMLVQMCFDEKPIINGL